MRLARTPSFQPVFRSTTRISCDLAYRPGSHPTVGVALFGPKVSDQLSSLSEKLQVRIKIYSYIRFRTSAYKCRSGGTNEFLPSTVSGEILSSSCGGSGTSGAPLLWDGSWLESWGCYGVITGVRCAMACRRGRGCGPGGLTLGSAHHRLGRGMPSRNAPGCPGVVDPPLACRPESGQLPNWNLIYSKIKSLFCFVQIKFDTWYTPKFKYLVVRVLDR